MHAFWKAGERAALSNVHEPASEALEATKEEIKVTLWRSGKGETRIIGQLLENMEYIMAGHEGQKMQPEPGKDAGKKKPGK